MAFPIHVQKNLSPIKLEREHTVSFSNTDQTAHKWRN